MKGGSILHIFKIKFRCRKTIKEYGSGKGGFVAVSIKNLDPDLIGFPGNEGAAGENMIQPHPVLFGIIYGLIGFVVQHDGPVADYLAACVGKLHSVVADGIKGPDRMYIRRV